MAGTPPNTIVGGDYVRDALKTKSQGNDDDVYSKLDPDNAIGTYSDLPTRLTAMQTQIDSTSPAGAAYVKPGTAAERAAYTSMPDGMRWHETDTALDYIYDATTTTWTKVPTTTTWSDTLLDDTSAADGRTTLDVYSKSESRAIPPLMIPLINWQTNSSEYTVEKQDVGDSNGHGADSFYRYVFTEAILYGVMYTAIPVPFSGYNLQLNMSYRMSTSVSGDVLWKLAYKAVSAGDTIAEYANWAAFDAADDATLSFTDTPSATANVINTISGTDIVIPSTAYAEGDLLLLALIRDSDDALDTHTGDAQVSDTIFIKPVLA